MIPEETYFNPFPGLRSFEEEEEYLFFGREKQIDDLINKLSKTRFLAVVGSSGSGKSSLVKSGLLPSLHSGYLAEAGSSWRICTFRPGSDPIGNLSSALWNPEILGAEAYKETSSEIIESILRRTDRGIGNALKQLSSENKQNILIVVDQFEELFRFSKYEKTENKGTRASVTFINLLIAASKFEQLPIYVVFTMRSDFIGDCTEFRGLPEAINEGQYLIPRMTREERKIAITGPIAVGGAEITQSLLATLLNDVGDSPDQLPILQHALMRTWEYWYKNSKPDEPIDLVHYKSIGTMTKALSLHAEEAYFEIGNEKGREVCKKIFRALTEKSDDGRGTRRPTVIKEICDFAEVNLEEAKNIIDVFRLPGRSFLMPPVSVELTENTVIDISHESLMRVWERLIGWVEEEVESADLYLRLANTAALYQEGKTGLWRDPELLMAINWRNYQKPNLVWAKRYDPSFERAMNFLDYSQAEKDKKIQIADKKRKSAIVRLRIFMSIITLAFLFAVYFGVVAWNNQKIAEVAKDEAIQEKRYADSLKIIANGETKKVAEQKNIAEKAKVEAENSFKVAQAQKILAEKATSEAIWSLNYANVQKKIAIEQTQKAVLNAMAEAKAKEEALTSKEEALEAKRLVEMLRLLAEAKNIALKSKQLINNPERDTLSLQLAFLAYALNKKFNGSTQNRIIYEALKDQLSKYYTKVKLNRQDQKTTSDYDLRTAVFVNETEFITAGDEGVFNKYRFKKEPAELIVEKASKKFEEAINTTVVLGNNIIAGTVIGKILIWDYLQPNSQVRTIYNSALGKTVFINHFPAKDHTTTLICGFEKGVKIIKLTNEGKLVTEKTLFLPVNGKIQAGVAYLKANEIITLFANGKSLYKLKSDTESSQPEECLVFSDLISSVQNSSNLKFLAIGGVNGNVIAYENQNNVYKVFSKVRGHTSSISNLIFTANDSILISGSFDHSIFSNELYPTKNDGSLVYKENRAWVRDIEIDRSGNYLLSVGQSGLVQIWPVDLKTVLKEIIGVNSYSGYLHSPINKIALKEELGQALFKSLCELGKDGNLESLWVELQKTYLND